VFTNDTTETLPAVKQFFSCGADENCAILRLLLIWFTEKLNKLKMNKAPGVDFVSTKC